VQVSKGCFFKKNDFLVFYEPLESYSSGFWINKDKQLDTNKKEVMLMDKWNEQAAPNNNLPPKTIKTGELVGHPAKHEFSEELSDGGERDQFIERQKNNLKMK